MSVASSRKHPFHILDPSPWPLVGSIGAFITAYGGVQVMHGESSLILALGIAVVLITMYGWWASVVREGIVDHAHTAPVRRGLRMGMGMFIASEVMFFVAFFWAYFHNALHISPVIENTWPPADIELLHGLGLPLINTLILVSSGFVLMWGRNGLIKGNQTRLVLGIFGTVAMGIAFLILQAIEYGEAAFTFDSGIYASTFYMATGFHGFHVFVGACTLAVMGIRAAKGHFTPQHHLGLEAAEWYWHFVDVVWLFLYVFFYLWVGLG